MRASPLLAIAVVYVVGSFVTGPVGPTRPSQVADWRLGLIFVGRPITTWGDPPLYPVMVNSLIEDGDLDLRNNFDQAQAGDWDLGTRFRGADLDRHVETDRASKQLRLHAPVLPMPLAPIAWPFRGSEWVESVCIWFTLAVTLCGLALWARLAELEGRWLVLPSAWSPFPRVNFGCSRRAPRPRKPAVRHPY